MNPIERRNSNSNNDTIISNNDDKKKKKIQHDDEMVVIVVKVVLLVNGIGANPLTYRPKAHESQWWNRRDALVRCVTAFLFGGGGGCNTATTTNNTSKSTKNSSTGASTVAHKELILLFDDDWSYFSMTYTPPTTTTTSFVPNEHNIIQLWKYSSQNPGIRIVQKENGLSCLCMTVTTTTTPTPPTVTLVMTNEFDSMTNDGCYNPVRIQSSSLSSLNNNHWKRNTMDINDDDNVDDTKNSKRSVIEYLHTNCSIEFLRHHRLNSSLDILARKMNKTKLLEIKGIWDCENNNNNSISNNNPKKQKLSTTLPNLNTMTNETTDDDASVRRVIQHILQPHSSLDRPKVIAVTLHESSQNEFPCWDDDDDESAAVNDDDDNDPSCHETNQPLQICFFLGAVRDMYKNENRIVRQICDTNHVPLLRIRFGPVSEFTSKILSVLSYHASNHHRLLLGMKRSIARIERGVPNVRTTNEPITERRRTQTATLLHYICHVPVTSDLVTSKLSHQNRVLWCMVRCTVTCLWRSRLAGGKHNRDEINTTTIPPAIIPINKLSFLFNDGVLLTMDQNDLVIDMAQQHQAAPSEYQILSTIRNRLDSLQVKETKISSTLNDRLLPSTLHHALFYDAKIDGRRDCPMVIINFMGPPNPVDHCWFYQSIDTNTKDRKTKTESFSSTIAICIPIRPDTECSVTTGNDAKAVHDSFRMNHHYTAILAACTQSLKNRTVKVISGHDLVNIDDNCIDQEGAIITMIQHLAYQGRLINVCHQIPATK